MSNLMKNFYFMSSCLIRFTDGTRSIRRKNCLEDTVLNQHLIMSRDRTSVRLTLNSFRSLLP